jgi:type III secretory pathway component EscV
MSNQQLKVAVELDDSLKGFIVTRTNDGKLLMDYLSCYLKDILEDLGLEVGISLRISITEGKVRYGSAVYYEVIINDQKCKFGNVQHMPSHIKELATSIGRIISYNRELIVTKEVCQEISEKWSLGNLPSNEFYKLLSEYVCRRFSINMKDVLSDLLRNSKKGLSAEELFEKSIAQSQKLSVRLSLSKTLYSRVFAQLTAEADLLQDRIFNELGIILPRAIIGSDENLRQDEFQLQLNDLRSPPVRRLPEGKLVVEATLKEISALKIVGERIEDPATGREMVIIENRDDSLKRCQEMGYSLLREIDYVLRYIYTEVRLNAGSLITIETIKYLLDSLRDQLAPYLVEASLRRFDIVNLSRVFRGLLDEQVSIKNLRSMLESLLAINGSINIDHTGTKSIVILPSTSNLCPTTKENPDPSDYSNYLRMTLKEYILGMPSTIYAYILDAPIEERISRIENEPLEEVEFNHLMEAVFNKIGLQEYVIILTTLKVRRKFRNVIHRIFPLVKILAVEELMPHTLILPTAIISWN